MVSIEDLPVSEIEHIFELADSFAHALARGESQRTADGLIMATLFYEPSTRTRLSFESAMHRLGGAVISSPDMHASSAAKGESLADTARVVSAYADVIVLRHPSDGAAQVAAEYARVPVINAGDGSREHPTQTLCDLYVLSRKKGGLKGLTVAICGDLKFGRTVHSLIYALARFGANIVTAPFGGMELPEYVLDRVAAERNYRFSTVSLDELKSQDAGFDALYLTPSAPHQMALFTGENPLENMPVARPPVSLDAFYLTRLQRERLAANDAPLGRYLTFDARALRTSRSHHAVVMHPLPRTDELAYELDSDPRAVYFEQAAAGVPVRMALIAWLMEHRPHAIERTNLCPPAISFKGGVAPKCANLSCITRHEGSYLQPRFRFAPSANRASLSLRCDFCERNLRIDYVGHTSSRRYYPFDESLHGYVRQWMEDGTLAVFDSVKEAEERGYEPYRRGPQREIMNSDEISRACEAIAAQITADATDPTSLTIVGIVSRGALLALRLRELIMRDTGVRPPCAALDVYGETALNPFDDVEDFQVDGRLIVLVDDVINSGWTVQRAMTVLWQRGRPAGVKLAVLIDRGHRALPIRPNYIGKSIPTARTDRVQVRISAPDGEGRRPADRVLLYSMLEGHKAAENTV
ncbi:MAG TPA: phosphoribosyltransferase family protein [Candidatus Binataceae bacterium]|nr:phosphoribosyltransferase family protein [Candidatus Binataceae bacterium]